MISQGLVLQEATGTYALNDQAEVTVRLPSLKWSFPVMVLRRDATSLLLMPKAGKVDFDH
jgi:hypothetical protein